MSTLPLPKVVLPEQKLWNRVLIRAWEEAQGGHVYTGDMRHVQYQARKWLTRKSKGLLEVCELAGYSELEVEKLIKNCRERFGDVGKRKDGRD